MSLTFKKLFLFLILALLVAGKSRAQQNFRSLVKSETIQNNKAGTNGGTSCSDAVELYPSDDCSNSCGAQYCGEYQCEAGDCANENMTGTGGLDGSCTPDNDAGQTARWIKFTATAGDITIGNETDYSGPGASNIEKKDYVLYSGSCGSLTEIGCAADVASGGSNTFSGLTVGQTYYIMVTRSQTSINEGCATCNAAATCLTSTVPYSPTNNNCSGAVSLSSGVPVNTSTANSTATGPGAVCLGPSSGSVENNVWYQWCAPATWTPGDSAYIHIYDQTCNSTSGLQVGVFAAGETCGSLSSSVVCGNAGTITDYYYSWVANPGECFYINIDGYAGTGCSFTVQVNDAPVLPIELLDFSAKIVENKKVELQWKTATEINNNYFTIERTKDGEHFTSLGTVQGAGNSNEVISYAMFDREPLSGISYYRLKQTDYDGQYTYSGLIPVEYESSTDEMEIYPNPVTNDAKLWFYATASSEMNITVFDYAGRVALVRSEYASKGVNKYALDLNKLPLGVYFIKVETANTIMQKKVVKK